MKEEAFDTFFKKNERLISDYAQATGITFQRGQGWAIIPEEGKAYYDPKMLMERGYSEQEALFLTLHETEHFRDGKEILGGKDGRKIWELNDALYRQGGRKKVLANVIDDIHDDARVTNAFPNLKESQVRLVTEVSIADRDLTAKPKHMQFVWALRREAAAPDQPCTVAPEVREAIQKLHAIPIPGKPKPLDLVESLMNPRVDGKSRIMLMKKYIEPLFDELYEQDLKDQEDKKKYPPQEPEQPPQEPPQNPEQPEEPEQPSEPPQEPEKPEAEEPEPDKQEPDTPEEPPQETEPESDTETSEPEPETQSPDDAFSKEYDEFFEKFPDLLDESAAKEAIEQVLIKEGNDDGAGKRAANAYAAEHGVLPHEIEDYRKEFEKIKPFIGPISDVIEGLIEDRKIPGRKLSKVGDHGVMLVPGMEVQAWMDMGDERASKTMLDYEGKEVLKPVVGSLRFRFVADLSYSMDGEKLAVQRRIGQLLLEFVSEITRRIDDNVGQMEHELDVKSQILTFGSPNLTKVVKPLSSSLTERQRIDAFQSLSQVGGSTPDFLSLQTIISEIDEEKIKDPEYAIKLKEGELKEVVIVLTDGESDSPAEVKAKLDDLRSRGVRVLAVGITSSASSVLETYKPDARLVEDVNELPEVFQQLLADVFGELFTHPY